MAIKISKVIKDLNVGRQTIADFLLKKGIEIDDNINARIQDDVYEMLVKEFKPDMDLKNKSEKMANERQKEKAKYSAKAESREIKTEIPGQKPTFLGKIDLDSAGKPKSPAKPEAAPKPKVEKPAAAEVKEQADNETKAAQTPIAEPKPAPVEPKEETKAEPQPVNQEPEPQPEVQQPVVEASEPVAEVKEDDVFKPVSETVSGPQLKVVGKIELSSLNQQTRPRKKTKEEKRNERIAKAQADSNGKRKRKRIGKEKIDIETAGNQAASQQGKRGKDDQGGKRKDKKGNRKPLRPEVSEEDVQRQMKETLARLTAKSGKKAAAIDYRKVFV